MLQLWLHFFGLAISPMSYKASFLESFTIISSLINPIWTYQLRPTCSFSFFFFFFFVSVNSIIIHTVVQAGNLQIILYYFFSLHSLSNLIDHIVMPVVHSKYYVVCPSTIAMVFKLCNDETFLCPVLWAVAREVSLTAKSDGAFLYLTSLNGLIYIAYQALAFSPSSFLTCPWTSFFDELTCYRSNLPYVSQFCAFPQAMFCAGSMILTLWFSMDYFLILRHTSSSSCLSKVSHIFQKSS